MYGVIDKKMVQKILIIINDAPYGTEKAYNALRLAMNIIKYHQEKVKIKIFLLADAVFCALPNQKTPEGYYNTERMLKYVLKGGGRSEGLLYLCRNSRN